MVELKENFLIFEDGSKNAVEKKLILRLHGLSKKLNKTKPKQDAILINEGKEGWGKTNSSVVEAAVLKALTKRKVYLFFHLKEMMEFALRHEDAIIIWDEPGLDSLSSDQINNVNKDLQRFYMTARKKGHVYLINWTRFWKFNEYLATDRGDGMVHMSDKNIGRFIYIPRNNFEKLWYDKRTKNQRNYKKYAWYGGAIPEIMEDHFHELDITINNKEHCTYNDYQSLKDEGILSIGNEKKPSKKYENLEKRYRKLQYKVSQIKGITKEDLAVQLGFNRRTISEWGNYNTKD